MVARPPRKDQLTMVPMEALRSADGKPGLDVVYYEEMCIRDRGEALKEAILQERKLELLGEGTRRWDLILSLIHISCLHHSWHR